MIEELLRIDPGPTMSQGVRHRDTIYLAGQVARTPFAPVVQQTMEVLEKIDDLLLRMNSHRDSLISATIHLADLNDFAAMNAVWSNWIPEGAAPVRTTVCAPLVLPGLAVEITIMAAARDNEREWRERQ